jgi:heterodisulfide reductase subunit C
MSLFLTMNATDRVLQLKGAAGYHDTGNFAVSGWLAVYFENYSISTLIAIERTSWWIHIAGIFAFLNYLPYSKHLHVLLAFPNAYYMRLTPQGEMENMESIQKEVKLMMDPSAAAAEPAPADGSMPKFGAKDVFDLSWKSLLDAYSCTECGRCTSACPANITGKLLSPRKIMMSTRDRMEEAGKIIKQKGKFEDDGKSLLHHYISTEELRACTSCNACVTECPIGINPLSIILELRRNLVMEESNAPQEWNSMFSNIENNFAPWKFSPQDRAAWTSEMS